MLWTTKASGSLKEKYPKVELEVPILEEGGLASIAIAVFQKQGIKEHIPRFSSAKTDLALSQEVIDLLQTRWQAYLRLYRAGQKSN